MDGTHPGMQISGIQEGKIRERKKWHQVGDTSTSIINYNKFLIN